MHSNHSTQSLENQSKTSVCVDFTMFTASTPLCKEFSTDGNVITKTSHANMYAGSSETLSLSLHELKEFIPTLSPYQALGLGTLRSDLHHTRHNLCTKSTLSNFPANTGHTRSKENYTFKNSNGFILFDYDGTEFETLDDVYQELMTLLPELKECEVLGVSSSSRGVYVTDNPHIKTNANGCHFYVVVNDQMKIPAIGCLLRLRSWQQGKSYFRKGKKSFLESNVFDRCVFTASRIIFEAPPIVGKNLSREQRNVKKFNPYGGVLDVAGMMPILSGALEKKTYLPDALSKELTGLVRDARNKLKDKIIKDLTAEGLSPEKVKKVIDNLLNCILTADDALQGEKTGENTVARIIAEIRGCTDLGKQFLNDTFLDPNGEDLEFGKTELYANEDGSIILNSFAHGGAVFRLTDTTEIDESPFLNALPPTQGGETTMTTPEFDIDADYQHLNLLQHIDDNHICKRVAMLLHEQTYIPASSLLMVGLGCISGYTHLNNVVCYRDGTALPIGLYVVVEQPSGTGKSNAMNKWLAPFNAALNTAYGKAVTALSEFDTSKGKPPEYLDALNAKQRIASKFSSTNATAEGLEKSLLDGDGFFFCASSEQGLFNSLLGFAYKDSPSQNNNDILLSGYDAGFTRSVRAGREGFCGRPVGAVTMFAQTGSIDKVISASQGTGLSERFLCLAEPSPLGFRDHTRPFPVDNALMAAYAAKCSPYATTAASGQAIDFNTLRKLTIRDADWALIANFKNSLEPKLNKEYAHQTLIGAAAKIEQSIMKIASNLHLMGDSPQNNVIETIHIRTAIKIARDLLRAFYTVCAAKGICGQSVEMTAILNVQALQNNKTVTIDDIIRSRKQVAPFKDMQNKAQSIRATVEEMVIRGLLVEVSKGAFKKA